MTTSEQILWHAGLLGSTSPVPNTVSAATLAGNPADIEAAASDFVTVLDAYNRDLNGLVPSAGESGSDAVPRDIAYAVGEVARMLRESGADRSAWRVETAWLAVLEGDIDDVGEHVGQQEAAREA